jgi:subtilase family serine protease
VIRLIGMALLAMVASAYAGEEARQYIPQSSVAATGDAGVNVRTHVRMLVPPGGYTTFNDEIRANPVRSAQGRVARPMVSPPSPYGYETPESIACVYGVTTPVTGCSPINTSLAIPSGGSKAIAIVDAYHYPNALADLTKFSNQFGLPVPTSSNFSVVYASGTKPANSPLNWEVEAALDLQWAHAMAPNAMLYLVEAKSNSIADLIVAVDKATALVTAAGGGQVSMSWGSAEFASESSYDSHFNGTNVVYFASSGDSAGTSWPCVSSKVVCVGGTTIRRDSLTGSVKTEVAWTDGGGGVSTYISKPSYQSALGILSTMRGVPDVALAADPISGAWVYYTASNNAFIGWLIVGGTSWSSPTFAGIVNRAGAFSASSASELVGIYANPLTGFRDIAPNPSVSNSGGWCGYYGSSEAAAGWDPCTGVGVNSGLLGK